MAINGISANPAAGIDNVLAQLRMAQARTQQGLATGAANPTGSPAPTGSGALRGTLRLSADEADGIGGGAGAAGVQGGFAAALRSSLDQVSAAQSTATQLGQKFEKGEGNVDLNDVMVAMQKANVSFQAVVQVRNRMVSAYHDIMNMQI